MKYILIISLSLPILLLSCKPKSEFVIFTGITETNENGMKISDDITDWKFDDEWILMEEELFTENSSNVCDFNSEDYTIIAFPNPCDNDDIVSLHCDVPENKRVEFRIVDENFNVLLSKDSVSTSIWIDIESLNINIEIIRIYYKVIGDNCELKGHGDIQVN